MITSLILRWLIEVGGAIVVYTLSSRSRNFDIRDRIYFGRLTDTIRALDQFHYRVPQAESHP